MLPRRFRLTRPDDFRRTVRSGLKATTPSLILYGLPGDGDSPRVGVTVNKAVGGSVVRHHVARRIRHTMADLVVALPPGSSWVVRALPAAARSHDLAEDLKGALSVITSRWRPTDA